jgi:hypothetical protein
MVHGWPQETVLGARKNRFARRGRCEPGRPPSGKKRGKNYYLIVLTPLFVRGPAHPGTGQTFRSQLAANCATIASPIVL